MSEHRTVNFDRKLNAEKITDYNPSAIAKYYRYRPWQVIWRALKIILFFGSFLVSIFSDKLFEKTEVNKYKRANELRELLTKLGPTFIKVGQALSTRPDLIRKSFLNELIKLQDQLPPFDNETAFNIIEQQLECSVDEA
ncbi:MAG: AarF/ABC1/UbiB kinase family protein, partial [Xenococcaceae cyanobacterium]